MLTMNKLVRGGTMFNTIGSFESKASKEIRTAIIPCSLPIEIKWNNKKWVSLNDMLEHFEKYKKQFRNSKHIADRKLIVYINSWINELLENSPSNNSKKNMEKQY